MFKILDGVCTPKRGTKYSAYVDLFAREDCTIGAGETKIVKLGVKIDLDKLKSNWINKSGLIFEPIEAKKTLIEFGFNHFLKSHYLEIALRSSLGVKGLIISNGIGIIDLDYPDEIGLIVHNPLKKKHIMNILSETEENGYNMMGHKQTYSVKEVDFIEKENEPFVISKGDKIAQCTLKEHKGYLMGYETEILRTGGFGSTDNKEQVPIFDKPDFFKCNVVN